MTDELKEMTDWKPVNPCETCPHKDRSSVFDALDDVDTCEYCVKGNNYDGAVEYQKKLLEYQSNMIGSRGYVPLYQDDIQQMLSELEKMK